MPKIFKPAGKSKYVVFYTDHSGRRRKKTLEADRRISERIAASLLEKVALRKSGLIDDRDERRAENESIPLKEHLESYAEFIASDDASPRYVQGVVHSIQTILDSADPRIRSISDLDFEPVKRALAKIAKTRSVGTMNNYVQKIKSFSRWLWETKRAKEYTLAKLETKVPKKHERKRIRRRMTDQEVLALISAAQRGPFVRGLSGPDRAMVYRLAHGTGFRAKELRTLTPERFRLDDDPPTVTVLACYSKNGQEAVQPIAESLAIELKPWLATKAPGRSVFEGMSPKSSEMIQVDLQAAGVPYETDDGVADFHSSRGTFISNLIASGASVKTTQELARHSTPNLTIGVYARASLHDKRGAVEKLPDFSSKSPEAEAMQATGTYGAEVHDATQDATQDAEYDESDCHNILSCNAFDRDHEASGRVYLQRCHDR
jgi:integrase